MRSELFVLAAGLVAKEEPFALATVVRRQSASSAQAGDGALITADGAFHGWLGGSCTQPTVVRESLKAIADGAPRLIALAPDPQTEKRPGILVFPMTCHSGGSVDIYIEPVLPPARLLVFGVSPVAQGLARLGHAMGFAVDVADPAADRSAFPPEIVARLWMDPAGPGPEAFPGSRPFAVVATMGERDEAAVRAALSVDARVPRRGREPQALCRDRGRARVGRRRARVARLDPQPGRPRHRGARAGGDRRLDPRRDRAREESFRRHRGGAGASRRVADACGADGRGTRPRLRNDGLRVAAARHTTEIAGRTWYFCCGGCREKFLASPGRYTTPHGAGAGAGA